MTAPTEPAAAAGAAAAQLYGLPLEEFTAARNVLARQLAKGGDKAGAEAVKKLPKPSKVAWALNQLARRHPDDVEQLLGAGARLREAQQRALAGDASRLREATRVEQALVDRLLDVAVDLFGSGGAAARDRLRATLRAAANDPASGRLLRDGRLVAEVESAGFGLDGLPELPDLSDLSDLAPLEAEPGGPPIRRDDQDDDRDEERARRQQEERARRQAHRDAQREAERVQREAQRLHDRAMRLVEQAELAERRAREARQEADAAVQAAEEAEQRAVDAAGRAAALEPR